MAATNFYQPNPNIWPQQPYQMPVQMQQQNNPMANLQQQVANLKAQFAGQDPNDIIQQMLNSGKVSQEQYNAAVQKYNQLQQMFGK